MGEAALAALRVPGIDPIDVALPAAQRPIGHDEAEALILDDYHMLTDARIHEGVEYLLSYLPSLRLVIAGQLDPPLPLARMRARGELTEIRAADLGSARRRPPAWSRRYGTAPARTSWTRWWTARRLGGRPQTRRADHSRRRPAARAAEVRGDDRHVDFLTSEVLDRLPTDRRDFLVRTAVLDRLCGSLCDAVLDRAGSSSSWRHWNGPTCSSSAGRPPWCTAPPALPGRPAPRTRRPLPPVPGLLRRAADWYWRLGRPTNRSACGSLRAIGSSRWVLLAAEDDFLEQGIGRDVPAAGRPARRGDRTRGSAARRGRRARPAQAASPTAFRRCSTSPKRTGRTVD